MVAAGTVEGFFIDSAERPPEACLARHVSKLVPRAPPGEWNEKVTGAKANPFATEVHVMSIAMSVTEGRCIVPTPRTRETSAEIPVLCSKSWLVRFFTSPFQRTTPGPSNLNQKSIFEDFDNFGR